MPQANHSQAFYHFLSEKTNVNVGREFLSSRLQKSESRWKEFVELETLGNLENLVQSNEEGTRIQVMADDEEREEGSD